MKKINANFNEQLLKNSKNAFSVIVTTTGVIDSKKLGLSPIDGLENIYTGSLLPKKIFDLEKIIEIIAIEPDGEMRAWKK
ncbi:hypothetical protein FHS57_004210 [Runella defluvii]|uniref:Uncharacterized protein n=1 Tax=Runella defluvii TaxID=370973 RepID=A0A7W6ES64_9BACT|nr:hypothetical protein [Runella defluvii]MBB3840197.1 hypothetical protein [Runella defluvii]